MAMYSSVFWENVNSIYRWYTCTFIPNLGSTSIFVMYNDVFRLIIIHIFLRELVLVLIFSGVSCYNYRSLVDQRWRDLV